VTEEHKEIEATLKGLIKKQIGKFAVPEKLLVSYACFFINYI